LNTIDLKVVQWLKKELDKKGEMGENKFLEAKKWEK
jgi:hypothetical protein